MDASGESARESIRRGDLLADLYRAEHAHVVNLAYLLTSQRQLAEDLAQEAFLRVASRIREVSPDAFGAYLRQTVVNLVRSHYRHARVERRYADRVESDAARLREARETSSSTTDADTRDELWSALQLLPIRQREAIVCRFYLDLSEEQTADTMRVAVGTVKSATSRGLQTLRVTLEAERRP
jgi:RNA polymerase sigma factor (sigma-70 family)